MQQLIQASVQAAITAVMANMPQGPSGPAGNQGPVGPAGPATGGTRINSPFHPQDIGYFDSNPDLEPVEVKENH